MSLIVKRTCTEVLSDSERQRREPTTQPLEAFRSTHAYVLLGDPGSGKSIAFKTEAEALGPQALLISARDFQTLEVNVHPEWQGRTLFIDGLDEIRVGSGDRREALDNIRRRLDILGKPPFRISCREADWLGDNDRNKLSAVTPDSRVAVARLDPLTDVDIERILNAHPEVDDARQFMADAKENRVESLLANPLTLRMLASAVGGGHGWPESKLQTFDMACRQMATEYNDEHIAAGPPPPVARLLDIASHLCAYQLLSGAAGSSLAYNETNIDFINPDDLADMPREAVRHALSSRIFTGDGVPDGCLTPTHRQIAEFLAARHLAQLIDDGLPVRRVLPLITAGDGMVVTVFRGLSAWLAALCPETRRDLIHRDPVGVGLYGDLSGFSIYDKSSLLMSLNREAADYGINVAAFAPLVTPEMEGAIGDLLKDERRDMDHQATVDLMLRALHHGTPRAGLAPILRAVIYDDTRWPRVTEAALSAFIHTTAEGPEGTVCLRKILSDIEHGKIPDPDNELLGTLLTHLYPRDIAPPDVWGYLTPNGNPDVIGAYFVFWEHRLLNQSSPDDLAGLLDRLHELMPGLRSTFRMYYLDRLPIGLLAKALESLGDEQRRDRLHNWLRASSYPSWDPPRLPSESIGETRTWLEQRPDAQKAVLLEGLLRCPDDDGFEMRASEVWDLLHNSSLPSDFGLWCLDTAVAWADTKSRMADWLLRQAVHLCGREAGGLGLSHEVIRERTRGQQELERRLTELLLPPPGAVALSQTRGIDPVPTDIDHRHQKWIEHVRCHADALRENKANPRLLFDLARAYFGDFLTPEINWDPEHGLSELLESDDLVTAAMAGLCGTVFRADIPVVSEIIQIFTKSQMHPLGLPFLAGINEMDRADPDRLERLSRLQMEQAVAFNYCTPIGHGSDPAWYLRWLDSRPDLVADVLVKCAAPAVRSGKGHVPELYQLVHLDNYSGVTALASLRLLASFPLRCTLGQLEMLDSLLWAALRCADRMSLLSLIAEKLSRKSLNLIQRIHWLSVGVIIDSRTYLQPLESLVSSKDERIRRMAAFFAYDESLPFLVRDLDARTLRTLISLMGRTFEPVESGGWSTPEMRAAEQVDRLIHQLASLPGSDASQALEELSRDAGLTSWGVLLERVLGRQRAIHRDASYHHPGIRQIRQTLINERPANAGDLAALLVDRLGRLAERIRTGNTDDWRQYWNEGTHGHPKSPKIEVHCRDALLSDLRALLPSDVNAEPEVEYANDRRADIRVSHGPFSVPIEVKKANHRNLWSALHNQLIVQYASDPATDGHGIYVVFWFAADDVPPPPKGRRPTGPTELRQLLEDRLTEAESRRISICVVDVSPAG